MSKKNKASFRSKELSSAESKQRKKNSSSEERGVNSMTWWLIALVAVLPVLYSKQLIEPVLSIRYIFLGVFVLVFLLVFFFRSKEIIPPSFLLPVKIIFLLASLYAGWNVLSLINALNPHQGFYIIARQLLNATFLFIIMITVINEEKQILKLIKAMVLVSIVQSFVGILQFYGVAFTTLPGNFVPYGLMANRNLFGSAQMLLLPFSLLILLKGNKTWKFVAAISVTGLIISIIISQTRSAWLATAVIFSVAFMLFMLFFPADRKKWLITSIVSLGVVIAIGGTLLITNENADFTTSIKERLSSFIQNDTSSTHADYTIRNRVDIRNKTLELIKKNPLIGVGAGNWRIAVPALGTASMLEEEGKNVPDRAHNVYLHICSESGIPGVLLYLGVWLAIALLGFKVLFKTKSDERKQIVIMMLAVMGGFASDCLFSFPEERIEHMMYLTIAGGIILGIFNNQFGTSAERISFPKPLSVLLLAIAAFSIFIGIEVYNFETHMSRARVYDKAQRYADVLTEVKAGKSYFVTLAQGKPLEIYSSIAYKKMKNYDMAIEEGKAALQFHPNSFMLYNNIGTTYSNMGQYEKAIENYRHALSLVPRSNNTIYNLGTSYFRVKNYAACIETLSNSSWMADENIRSMVAEAERQLESAKQVR